MRHSQQTVVLYLLATLGLSSSDAATLRVKFDAPGPTHDGASWATAYTSVQPAINAAASGDAVWVAKGTYNGAITMKQDVALYGGFAGTEDDLSQRDILHNETVLDGSTLGTGSAMAVSVVTIPAGATSATVLDGFTVTRGTGKSVWTGERECYHGMCYDIVLRLGGGIHVEGGSPVIRNNRISENDTLGIVPPPSGLMRYRGLGGAVYLADGSALIEGNDLYHNTASLGGGIYVASGSPVITRNQIRNGTAQDHFSTFPTGEGGGIYANTAVTVAGNVIAENQANGWGSAMSLLRGGDILNNTIVRNGNAETSSDIRLNGYPEGYRFANNIIAYNAGGYPAGANYRYGNGNDNNGTILPPKFVDLEGGDFHLLAGSPCIDTGNDAFLATVGSLEIDGEVRKSGAHVDYGADEYVPVAGRAVWATQPSDTRGNVFIRPAPVVRIVDGAGQTITTFNRPVTLSIQPGTGAEGATLAGNTADAVNGVATFPGLTVTKPGNGYILVPAAKTLYGEALPADGSAPFTVGSAATRLEFRKQPVGSTPRVPFSPAPVVAALDDNGAPVTEFNGPVTLSIVQGTGTPGALMTGTATVYATGGLATFSEASISKPGSGYVLAASNPLLAPAASQPVKLVPSDSIKVRADGDDSKDGASWSTAFRTVQAALDAAGEEGSGEVWVAAGTYPQSITIKAPTALYGGFTGTETDREARNPASHATILDGQSKDRVILIPDRTGVVTIDGFTVQNGAVGSLYGDEPIPIGTDQGFAGGGLESVNNSVTLTRNRFTMNIAQGVTMPYYMDGVGHAAALLGGSAIVRDNVFIRQLSGDLSTTGGTLYTADADVTVERNLFQDNAHRGLVIRAGHAMVRSNLFTGNEHSAIVASAAGEYSNNTVTGTNVAWDSWSAAVNVGDPSATVVNNIIAFNHLGIRVAKPEYAANLRKNCLYGNMNGNYAEGLSYPEGQDPNIKADPLFADRANGNYHLLAGSPAIDAGDDAVYIPGDLDLDGGPRKLGARIDIGAYEHVAGGFTLADAERALKIAAGLQAMAASDMPLGAAAEPSPVELSDALVILRKATGLDANP